MVSFIWPSCWTPTIVWNVLLQSKHQGQQKDEMYSPRKLQRVYMLHINTLNSWEPNHWSSRQYVEFMGTQSLEFTPVCWMHGKPIVGVHVSMLNLWEHNRWSSHQYVEFTGIQSLEFTPVCWTHGNPIVGVNRINRVGPHDEEITISFAKMIHGKIKAQRNRNNFPIICWKFIWSTESEIYRFFN